jgi:hypothetical protein
MVVVAFIVVVVMVYITMIASKIHEECDRYDSIKTYRNLRNDKAFLKKIGG